MNVAMMIPAVLLYAVTTKPRFVAGVCPQDAKES
jgi:hypothetical protein